MWFIELIKFIISPILTESRKAISLIRLAFIYVFYVSTETWQRVSLDGTGMLDIPTYQVVTLFLLLSYMIFKHKAVGLVEKFLDTLVQLRTGKITKTDE